MTSAMKKIFVLFILIPFVFSSCSKDETTPDSGTVTINNKTYLSTTYYVNGFSFSKAKKVSTLSTPGPDVLVYVNSYTSPVSLTLQANNLNPSFGKIDDYSDEQSAITAFKNLTTVGSYQWTEMADSIAANQIWIYRTGNQTYAKIRIISTVNETRDNVPYGECTFEWVYQPDGSTTFPAK